METTIKKIDPKEFGLQETEVVTIEQAFAGKIAERDGYISIYEGILKSEITLEVCKQAKELRNKLVKVRTGIAEIHKSQKAYFLAAGRFVDEWKNKETLPVVQMEVNLEEIEKHFERIEQAKIKALQLERSLMMQEYQAEYIPGNLGELTEQVFGTFLLGAKTAFEQKKEAERIALEAEQKRIADEKAEQERIRIENETLKVEREAIAAKAEAERLEREAEKEAERLEREAEKEAERKEAAKKEAEHQAELKAQREATEAAEKALAAKAEAERLEREASAKKIQEDLNKGDQAKFNDLVSDLEALKTKYQFKSDKNKKMYTDVNVLLDKVITHIKK